jgi:SPP1 family predicted phage head-tail adaptor
MPTYTASDLCKQIEFLQLSRTPDGGGGVISEWLPLVPPKIVAAKVHPRSSRERYITGQTASNLQALFVIRYWKGLTQDMRIAYNGRNFDILGVVDVEEEHAWFEIDAELRGRE